MSKDQPKQNPDTNPVRPQTQPDRDRIKIPPMSDGKDVSTRRDSEVIKEDRRYNDPNRKK